MDSTFAAAGADVDMRSAQPATQRTARANVRKLYAQLNSYPEALIRNDEDGSEKDLPVNANVAGENTTDEY
jgi:hypothetical protein